MEDLIWYLVSFVSYKVVVACLFSVPITHVIGVYLHCPKALRPWKYLLYPFTGGNRHVVFQLLGWALWAVSALAVLPVFISSMPVFLTKELPKIPHTHVDVVSGAAAALSFMGEMFAIKALLVYDAKGRKEPGSPKFGKPTSRAASAMVVVMGVLLTITGSLLLMALDYMPDIPSRVLYCCLSLSCLLTAASSTYGLGGFLRHVKGAGEDGATTEAGPARWQFFQPFAGGTVFVATQAVGWSLFSATIVLIVMMVQQLVAGVAGCVRCWAMGAGAMMMLAEVLLGVSLLTFRGKAAAQTLLRAASRATELRGLTSSWAAIHMPIFLMYLPMHFFFTLWTLAFTFMPLKWALATWVGFLGAYYAFTTAGYPAHTGVRRWAWLCRWFSRNLEMSLASWFGSVRIINEGGEANRKRGAVGKYVFGFQPHGLYPTGAGFLPLMPSFLSCFPGVQPVTLVASVMFFPPFVRDIAAWAGFRQVTRATFVKTLNEAKAVILCPGGQAEMVHTHRAFKGSSPFRAGAKGPREIVLHMRHKGFIKVAIEQGAAVVPVLAIGETLQLRNFIDVPALQQYSYKRLGFPVPYLLVGRWGLAPLPMRVPLVYVVGEAIDPPQLAEGGVVTQEHVDSMHAQYVAAMKQLWTKHHTAHPDYVDAKLVLLTDEGTVSFSPEPSLSPEPKPSLLPEPVAEAAAVSAS